jgi:hypothetical protein
MLTTRHPVDFAYTRQELDALFRYARDHDVEKGGRYTVNKGWGDEARAAAMHIWSHHWRHRATWEESMILGTCAAHWAPTPALWEIKTDESFALEDLMQALGRLELQALGYVKHGPVPQDLR